MFPALPGSVEHPLLPCVQVSFGSSAAGSSQQQVRPCPLCPDSDQIPQRSEMTRCAMNGSQAHYSITSSASASKVGGTTMPSAFAVFDKRYWAYCTRRVSKSKLKWAPPRAESLLARMRPP
jgi:hypothetical protein